MQILKSSREAKALGLKNPVITIGNFDGVHLGHQKILKKTIQRARALNGVSAVYTFHPHPLKIVRPEAEPLPITTFEEKVRLIEAMGIDCLICENFNRQFAEQLPEEGAAATRAYLRQHTHAFVPDAYQRDDEYADGDGDMD